MGHLKYNILLLFLGYVFLMMGNGLVPLTHPDEVFYAQTVKEMLEHQNWLTPILFDRPQFEKPILFYWLTALLAKCFGLTAFTARFWPAFFGVVGMFITYWFSWLLFNNKRVSFLAGVIQGTSFIYIALSRAVLTDMVFSMWVALALLCFYSAYRNDTKRVPGHVLFFFFTGLAVLTKGLLGFTFTAGTVVLFLGLQKKLNYLKTSSIFWGLLVFILVAIPWHLFMVSQYGDAFLQEYFHNVHVRRLFVAEHEKCDTWYFYFLTLATGLLPWSFFIAPTAVRIPYLYKHNPRGKEPFVFLLSWFLGVFLFIQPAHSKLASYVFPAFPVVTILSALCIDDFLVSYPQAGQRVSRLVQYSVSAFGAVLVLGSLGAVITRNYFQSFAPQPWPVAVIASIFGLLGVLLVMCSWKKHFYVLTGLLVLFPFSVILSFLLFKSMAEPWVSCRDIGEKLKKMDQSNTTVLASKFYVRGVRYFTDRDVATIDVWGKGFYSPHPIPFLNTDRRVADFLKTQPVTFAVVKKNDIEDLKRICALNGFSLQNLGGEGGKYILRIQP